MLYPSSSSGILYEDMQNEIEQLKLERTNLQIALSTAEMNVSKYQEKEIEYQQEVNIVFDSSS